MSSFVTVFFLLGLCVANAINFTTVYEWDKFDFIWPSGAYTSNGQIKDKFDPKNVDFRYMAIFGERLFLGLEMDSGIPATLVWLPTSGTSTAPPKLAPFPTLELHKRNNCDTIQVARGMETDTDGRLWVLDDGSDECPGKLWVFNLLNDTTERVHQFPDTVVPHASHKRSLLDIALDKTQEDYLAYISNSRSEQIVVHSRKMDKSRTVKTPGVSWATLALSPKREARQLYLRRADSNELYSMSVSALKNEGGSATAKLIGKWTDDPYTILIDSANVMYAAFWSKNYFSKWNISEPFREQSIHEVGRLDAYRPLTFALDTDGVLWMMQRNVTEGWAKTRHKLLKAAVGANSYQ
ncbi:protein yellow-like [Cloeon dipterum]|uniref:protein yellow-like n=1 Tax=Cloeon dipterum TaxID=197152 RepID=UPI00322057F1